MNFHFMRYVFTFILGLLITKQSFAETAFRSGISPTPKILVLIIACDSPEVFFENQKTWRSYMHLDREHVEVYFIKADPKLDTTSSIVDDVIWSKTEENYIPGILNKTILSMEAILPRLDEFDYVLRTNLSSFYYFPKLLEFLKTAPQTNFYCGVDYYGWFASGAGFILSPDLVKLLVENKSHFLDNMASFDDVLIGHFLRPRGVPIVPADRVDLTSIERWNSHDKNFADHFHFRVKNDHYHLRITDEVFIQRELAKMLYGVQTN